MQRFSDVGGFSGSGFFFYSLLDHELVGKLRICQHLVAPCRPRVDHEPIKLKGVLVSNFPV